MTTMTDLASTVVNRIPEGVRVDLGERLGPAIETHYRLRVQPSTSFAARGHGGWCDGLSNIDKGLILYRRTSTRRENFTLMHELAHHIVDGDDECLLWLMDKDEPDQVAEQLCNKIASLILVSAETRASLLRGRTLDAAAIIDLREMTQASLSCCSIVVADRLPCDGFVTISDIGSEKVFFATRTRDTRPSPWSGAPIPPGHPLLGGAALLKTISWWPQSGGGDRRQYYQSTARFRDQNVALFAADDLWKVETFHAGKEIEVDRGNDGFVNCHCGHRGPTRMWPCAKCGRPECPRCQECDCQRRARLQPLGRCTNCTQQVRTHLLVDGYCDQCR